MVEVLLLRQFIELAACIWSRQFPFLHHSTSSHLSSFITLLSCSQAVCDGRISDIGGFDEYFVRTWLYYLEYCEAGFAARTLANYQIVFSRPGNPNLAPPHLSTELDAPSSFVCIDAASALSIIGGDWGEVTSSIEVPVTRKRPMRDILGRPLRSQLADSIVERSVFSEDFKRFIREGHFEK